MKKQLIFFLLGFVLLFVVGGFAELAINEEQRTLNEDQDSIIHLVDKLGAHTMEEDTVSFLTNGDTSIIQKLDVKNKSGSLVAIIYTGETKGKESGLQVAFAIDVATHKIVAMKILASNETPSYQGQLLASATFMDQFNDKDMTQISFDVDVFSGVTLTSTGIQKIMQLIRKQYDQDTDFTAPSDIVLVSKGQDVTDLNHYNYEFLIGEETVTVVVDNSYALVAVSNPIHEALVMETILKNRVTNFITSATLEGSTWTILIESRGFYNSVLTSTATVDDTTKTILTFTTNISGETYDTEYNEAYTGGSFNPVFSAVVSGDEITIVTGATYTSVGVIGARDVLYAFIEGGLGQ
ncbi:MAG: FMN-binding protein [Bacilli bacterium]|nr:FMN-binding protein [Bacilli bacterium]